MFLHFHSTFTWSICFVLIASSCVVSQQIPSVQAFDPQPLQMPQKQIDPLIQPDMLNNQHLIHATAEQQIVQIQEQGKRIQALNDELPDHIRQQLQQAQNGIEMPIVQSFSFTIPSGQTVEFKWDPSKDKELKLDIDVFELTSKGHVQVIKDAQEYQFVEVSAKSPTRALFLTIGKVFRHKLFTVNFDSDFLYLKLTNKNDATVIVEVDVQKLEYVVETGVQDNILSTSQRKMLNMIREVESTQIRREHLYKWQWGYYENELLHNQRVLGLTGAELLAILLSSCVQMYCLKNLLDNRAVV